MQTDRQAGRQTDRQTDRRRDMVKLIVGFRISAKAPKIIRSICYEYKRRLNVYLHPVDDEELGGKGRYGSRSISYEEFRNTIKNIG